MIGISHQRVRQCIWRALLSICVVLATTVVVMADDYTVAEGNRSLLVAVGCFWCGEQAFEQYAPGVVEAVSGYAGGENDNPTYRNHPGHYEVVLIEYDPKKTSFEVLVNYAYRNMDPFNGFGQFCDRGPSYYPAIFYETEEEMEVVENVLAEILDLKGWSLEDIAAPILPRPKFWTAEEYHQDYYIKNPANYGYYKNGCRRPQRLKEVWGIEEYKCFHEESHTCFIDTDGNMTSIAYDDDIQGPTVINADGEVVAAESNIKGAGVEKAGLLPQWAIIVIVVVAVLLVVLVVGYLCFRRSKKSQDK